MKTRVLVLIGGGAALAAAAGLTAHGQAPQYYQGKVSPPPPGLFPGARPAAVPPKPAPPKVTPLAARPAPTGRLSQPVVAGPDGVRQVGAAEPANPTGTPPFFIAPTGKAGGPVLPDPKPLPPAGPAPTVGVPPLPAAALPPIEPPAVALPTVSTMPTVVAEPAAPTITPVTPPKPVGTDPAATSKPAGIEPAALPGGFAPSNSGQPLPARQAPAVAVELVAPESVGVGQSLTYELVVKNNGPAAVSGVRVEDDLPPRCQLVATDPAAETTGDRLAWTIGGLDAGAERRIRVTVKPADEGELRTRAAVTYSTQVEARVRVTRPKLAVAMTGPDSARVGDRLVFQIQLTNSGSGPASRVHLQAKFSDGLSHAAGPVIESEIKDLAPGLAMPFKLEVTGAKAGAQLCTITATADGATVEPAKVAVTLVEPQLVVKQSGPPRCWVRGEPTYTIELSNPGTAPTDAVQVWASLPAGFDLAQASDGGAFADANRAVGWRVAGLPAGGTKLVTMRLKAVAPADGLIRTVAQVLTAEPAVAQAAVGSAGNRPLEARTETAVKAEGVPALRFEVADVEDPVEAGKEAVYEIRVQNQGTGPCTNVVLVADLADGTTAAGSTGPTPGKQAGQQVQFDPIPQFGVKGEAVYRVRVKGTQAGDFRFRVRLSCDQIRTPVVKEENTRFTRE